MRLDKNDAYLIFILLFTFIIIYYYCGDVNNGNIELMTDTVRSNIGVNLDIDSNLNNGSNISYEKKQDNDLFDVKLGDLIIKKKLEGKYLFYHGGSDTDLRNNNELARLAKTLSNKSELYEEYDRIFISWILAHDKFTIHNPYLLERHNDYDRFMEWPFDKNDFDTPLLDEIHTDKSHTLKNPETIGHESVNHVCHQIRRGNLFDTPDYGEYQRLGRHNDILVIKYFVIIKMGDTPTYILIDDGITNLDMTFSKMKQRLGSLTDINYRHYQERLAEKLNKLCKLIIRESVMEYSRTGLGTIMCQSNITNYQVLGMDVVIKGSDPYVSRIHDIYDMEVLDQISDSDLISEIQNKMIQILELK